MLGVQPLVIMKNKYLSASKLNEVLKLRFESRQISSKLVYSLYAAIQPSKV